MVDRRGRQPHKKKRGCVVDSTWLEKTWLGTTYALQLFACVLSLARCFPDGARTTATRMLCCQGKRCRYIGRGCGSLREGIGTPTPLISCGRFAGARCCISHMATTWFCLGTALSRITYSWHARDARILCLSLPGCQRPCIRPESSLSPLACLNATWHASGPEADRSSQSVMGTELPGAAWR